LSAFAQRFAANRLERVEQQVPAVEHRDRKQVDQTKVYRQQGGEPEHRDQPVLGDLTRNLSDANGSAQLVSSAHADDHFAECA